MDRDGHTAYLVNLPFAHPIADSENTEHRALRHSRVMVIGDDLSGRSQVFQLLLGWGAQVTQRGSVAMAFSDLIQGASRTADYHLIVVDSRGLNADTDAIARAVKQEPTLSAIPLVLIAPQRLSLDWKNSAFRAGYTTVLETPLDKTLLFNALHTTDLARATHRDGVVRLIDHYAAANRVAARLEILLAMQNSREQAATKAILEQSGHHVYTAENGAQALEALDNHRFDLAFLDFVMAEIDGLEVLRLYHQRLSIELKPQLAPVILMTEDGTQDTKRRCIDAGALAILVKPLRKHELLSATDHAGASTPRGTQPYECPSERDADKNPSASTILDQETLSDLELLGSGIGFVAELVVNFLRDGKYLLERMVTAQELGQAHIFRDIAHALKGSAGSVGAKGLFNLASEACTLRGKQFEQSSAQLVADLAEAFETARVSLLTYIEEKRRQNTH